MTNHPRKREYPSLNWIQEIIVFICNYFLSYFKPNQEYANEVFIDHYKLLKPQIPDHVHTYTPVHTPDTYVEDLVKHEPHATFPALAETSNSQITFYTTYTHKGPRKIQAYDFSSYPLGSPSKYCK